MGKCRLCGKVSNLISSNLSLCLNCILAKPKEAEQIALRVHAKSRKKFNLPQKIPRDRNGLSCNGCGNECKISGGKRGFCGLVENKDGKLIRYAGTPEKGLCEWYYDALPTNCVGIENCPGGTGCGYPKFAKSKGAEIGYYNLSVFYGSCNFNCLFCQNWHFRENLNLLSPIISAKELASKADEKVTCICFFGGDPSPQLMHAIETARIARENSKDILRVCMETNGNSNQSLLKRFAEIALESGGSVKVDLKVWDNSLSFALSGISNKATLENFKMLVKYHKKRPEVPFLHASTLLVPGYVEEEQVDKISKFIAKLDSTIPFSLLAFYPVFFMQDLPFTSWKVAENCLKVAKENGLEKVRIGNVHLLEK